MLWGSHLQPLDPECGQPGRRRRQRPGRLHPPCNRNSLISERKAVKNRKLAPRKRSDRQRRKAVARSRPIVPAPFRAATATATSVGCERPERPPRFPMMMSIRVSLLNREQTE